VFVSAAFLPLCRADELAAGLRFSIAEVLYSVVLLFGVGVYRGLVRNLSAVALVELIGWTIRFDTSDAV